MAIIISSGICTPYLGTPAVWLDLVGASVTQVNTGWFRHGEAPPFYHYWAIYPQYSLVTTDEQGDVCEGDPCDPVNGSHKQTEVDIVPRNNSLGFSRHYSSLGLQNKSGFLGSHWKHSFSQKMGSQRDKQAGNLIKSALFSSKEQACTGGWNNIKDKAFRKLASSGVASYTNGLCQISLNGSPVAVLPIVGDLGQFEPETPEEPAYMLINRPNGKTVLFVNSSGTWVNQHLDSSVLIEQANTWVFTDSRGNREVYDDQGLLIERSDVSGLVETHIYSVEMFPKLQIVSDNRGNVLTLNYAGEQLVSVNTAGETVTYEYYNLGDYRNGNLKTVTYNDGSSRTYHYDDSSIPHGLTSIVDEENRVVARWAFDNSGRVIMNEVGDYPLGSGEDRIEISYNDVSHTSTVIEPATGASRTYHLGLFNGQVKVTQITGTPCDNCGTGRYNNREYYANGLLKQQSDWNNVVTSYLYNSTGQVIQMTEAAGSVDERITTTTYNLDFPQRKATVQVADTLTSYSYFSPGHVNQGMLKTTTISDASNPGNIRTSHYTFFANGQQATQTLPSGNVITYAYDANFNLASQTNLLGHQTQYANHNDRGQPTLVTDQNGVTTTLGYDLRGRLTSQSTAGQVTSWVYKLNGLLDSQSSTDSGSIQYSYAPANQVATQTDSLGNSVNYSYDTTGNRISKTTKDSNDIEIFTEQSSFDASDRLESFALGSRPATQYSYDQVGNLINTQDPNLNSSSSEYDSFNRLIKTTDPLLGETLMTYDEHDELVAVTDLLGNVTSYTHDGLGNQIELDSPDTGITTYEYDVVGNRSAATDARGVRVEYHYDVLDRLTLVDYVSTDDDDGQDVSFSYDIGTNAVGRLSGMTDAVGTETYSYDARGNLISVTRDNNGTSYTTNYSYNGANRVTQIIYPSGMVVDYSLNAIGQVTDVDKSQLGITENLVNGVSYEPIGPMRDYNFGNGLSMTAASDQDYRLNSLQSGGAVDNLFSYDNSGNILTISDQATPANSQVFSYDPLYRLTTAAGDYGNENFEYDANGNRERYLTGLVDETLSYVPQSNRLNSQNGWTFSRDAVGNRTQKLDASGAGFSYVYANNNRLAEVSRRQLVFSDRDTDPVLTAFDYVVGSYQYDGRGQRLSKTANGNDTHFIYGRNGELLGEYDADGNPNREYVWLNGQLIAVITHETSTAISPAFIVDNDTAGTSFTGSWSILSSENSNGPDYRLADGTGNSYRWYISPPNGRGLQPGSYEVYAWWLSDRSYTSVVDYSIVHGGGTANKSHSHKSRGNRWQLLGTWDFADSEAEYIEVSATSGMFTADAIRFIKVQGSSTTTIDSYFVHSDHLGTPRAVSDSNQTTVWRWDSTPFGGSVPDEDSDGDSNSLTLNLRFPGQYFDNETGLYYNYLRTYDPEIGRYIESDPIELAGGLNTFGYALQNPARNIDPTGESVAGCFAGALVEPTPFGEFACACYAAYRGYRLINNLVGVSNGMPNCGGGGGRNDNSECEDEDNCDTPLNRQEIERLKSHLGGREALHKEKEGFGGPSSHFDLYKCRNGDIVVKRKGGGPILGYTGLNINNF